ncbi:dihydroorotate dehydrogenase electron transfer subunit [Mycoplasmatota bacterium WC30]
MKNIYKIISNDLIAKDTYKMILNGDTSKITKPGQFINIKIGDGLNHFLRRPISISSYSENEITIIYKVLGEGTKTLSNTKPMEELDILCPLGNGYTINSKADRQILIGGGVGVPPLLELAKQLFLQEIQFDVVLGFNNIEDIFLQEKFKEYTQNVFISTMDGSYGYKGNVINLIKAQKLEFDYYYACGPEKMLHALIKEDYTGQLSFEERMGCGFGACMGCSHKTIQSYKRICKEGPVLESWEVYIDE